jgi:tetratricopeptide (TPR) repeat protein
MMARVRICRLSGFTRIVMNYRKQPGGRRSSLQSSNRRVAIQTVLGLCFLLLSLAQAAHGQNEFESHLTDAVHAQSAGNLPAAIAAYQSALAIRRDVPEVWANLGLMQHQIGDTSGALQSFKTANQLQPKLFVPLLFLGIENLQLENRSEAIRYLTLARQQRPNDREVYMNLGRAYFGLKQFENASIAYRRATELDAKNGESWYRLGITYLEMSETASGEFARSNRQSPFFQRLDADSLSDQDKLAESAETFHKLLSGPASPPCTRSSYGLVLIRNGKSSEAQPEFQKDKESGGCSQANLGMIRLALEKDQYEAALNSLASLWTLDSGFIRAHAFELTRGMTTEQSKAFDDALTKTPMPSLPPEAISVLRQSLRGGRTLSTQAQPTEDHSSKKAVLPTPAQNLYLQGRYAECTKSLLPQLTSLSSQKTSLVATCSFYTGDFKTTLIAAKRLGALPTTKDEGLYWSIRAEQRLALLALAYAGEVEPNSIRLHELLAESYRDREKYADAEAEYKVALSINPKEFAALIGAATNYLQELRIDLASGMIQQALTENPTDPEANYIMSEVLIAEHKYLEAEPYLRTGLSANSELVPRVHALLGQVYASQGDTKRAIDEYKLGLPSDDDGSVHFQLGRLYQKSGEKELAATAFADSKALNQRRRFNTLTTFGTQQKNLPPQP